MKASLRARLARLEDATRRRVNTTDARLELLEKLRAMATRPRTCPLEEMSLAEQASLAIFGDRSREEAEEVAQRFEEHAPDTPGLDGLAALIRARICAEDRNKGRAVLGMPLLETTPKKEG